MSAAAMAVRASRRVPTRAPIRSGWTRSSARSCASCRASTTQDGQHVSDNGRYRIPDDNPFVSIAGARKEIWALGFRNPHRLHFAIDPSNATHNRLIANSVGMRTWETINIVHKGANYGYPLREGNEAMTFNNNTEPRPGVDRLPVRINATATAGRSRRRIRWCSTRTSPAEATRSAAATCIAARTSRRCAGSTCSMTFPPAASGVDYQEMLKADDGNPDTMAEARDSDPLG